MPITTQLDQIIADAITRHIFPGAVLLVAQAGRLLHHAAAGTTMYADAGSQPVAPATYYDIASLTKAFTATAALRLLDAGQIGLDTPVCHYLPDLRAQSVTVRHLLTHTSGLEVRLAHLRHLDPERLRGAVYTTAPTHPPGTHAAYVNVSSLLLGDVVAQAAGQPLDAAIAQLVLDPLGLEQTRFCPPPALRPHIPPTEWDEEWRGGLVQGSVHDESAHALGGVAGHAGLFSTAPDLWRFAQMWLDGGVCNGARLLQAETVALATTYQAPWLALAAPPTIRCGLGWMLDRPEVMGSAPPGSYGHTGFTGPVLVVVPRHELVLVLLCNRTYPRRAARAHFPVVAALLDALIAGLQAAG